MAYAQGADYLEQDLVMTKDDRLVVLHDHYLDRVTDVAERFRARAAGWPLLRHRLYHGGDKIAAVQRRV